MKLLIIISLSCFSLFSYSQVELRDSISFTNPDSSLRQIEGLTLPTSQLNLINQQSIVEGKINFTLAQGVNSLSASLTPKLLSYKEGLILYLLISSGNTDSVTLNIDNLGPKSVLKSSDQPIEPFELANNSLVKLAYDGNHFQVISGLNTPQKNCPNNFVSVNDEYCIEINENSDTTMWAAMENCGLKNARLCKWSEWYYACTNSAALGLADMTNNYEWLDDAGNYTNNGKGAGYHPGTGFSCESTNTLDPNTSIANSVNINFRCCYIK